MFFFSVFFFFFVCSWRERGWDEIGWGNDIRIRYFIIRYLSVPMFYLVTAR